MTSTSVKRVSGHPYVKNISRNTAIVTDLLKEIYSLRSNLIRVKCYKQRGVCRGVAIGNRDGQSYKLIIVYPAEPRRYTIGRLDSMKISPHRISEDPENPNWTSDDPENLETFTFDNLPEDLTQVAPNQHETRLNQAWSQADWVGAGLKAGRW